MFFAFSYILTHLPYHYGYTKCELFWCGVHIMMEVPQIGTPNSNKRRRVTVSIPSQAPLVLVKDPQRTTGYVYFSDDVWDVYY